MAEPSPAASDRATVPVPRSRLRIGIAAVACGAAAVTSWLLFAPGSSREPIQPASSSSSQAFQAAQEAMDAWARFASTGELDDLQGHFHPDGPQYAQLRQEAHSLRARTDDGPPYRFRVTTAAVKGVDDSRAVLHAELVVTRAGETTRTYAWELELVHQPEHGWTLWTVSTLSRANHPR